MKSVLIADDAIFMRMMMKDLLSKYDFEVLGEAENGQEALNLYKTLKPDLVLLDILMPIMDGLTAAEEILKFDHEAKVVMISAMGQKAFLDKATDLGVKDFVIKPFSPPKVIETLNKVLNIEQQEAEPA